MMVSLNMAYPCWDAPPLNILSKQPIEYQPATFRLLCLEIDFLESASAFDTAHFFKSRTHLL